MYRDSSCNTDLAAEPAKAVIGTLGDSRTDRSQIPTTARMALDVSASCPCIHALPVSLIISEYLSL